MDFWKSSQRDQNVLTRSVRQRQRWSDQRVQKKPSYELKPLSKSLVENLPGFANIDKVMNIGAPLRHHFSIFSTCLKSDADFSLFFLRITPNLTEFVEFDMILMSDYFLYLNELTEQWESLEYFVFIAVKWLWIRRICYSYSHKEDFECIIDSS